MVLEYRVTTKAITLWFGGMGGFAGSVALVPTQRPSSRGAPQVIYAQC